MFFGSAALVNAAEWKSEPSLFLKTQYNDNVRMRTDEFEAEGSAGFTLEPRVKFAGIEQDLWDVSIDTRAKITRFLSVEDSDSDNIFFALDGGKQTERSDWRLNTSFSRNTNLDTDFETVNPEAGIFGDRTERKTAIFTPSVNWNMSETSQLIFSLGRTDVSYDEVIIDIYNDYTFDNYNLKTFWNIYEKHRLGFTSTYSEYDSPDANFSYNQTVLQLDYTYTINPISNVNISFGGRRLDSTVGIVTGCAANGQTFDVNAVSLNGICPDTLFGFETTDVLTDVQNADDGVVINLAYTHRTETTSQNFKAGRTVIPSSFGSAQEMLNASYQLSIKNTERFTTRLILNAVDTETVSGTNAFSDRRRYRFEPSIDYALTKNWKLNILYRYISQNRKFDDTDAVSNAIFINLKLHWPKLVTTY